MHKTAWLYSKILFTVLVWGASFIATKVALRFLSPVLLVWMRFGFGVPILASAVLLRKQWITPKPKDIGLFFILGFLGITLNQMLQATGLQTSKASTTAWMVAAIPVYIAILGWVFLKENLRWLQWLGVFLAAFGVLVIVVGGDLGQLVEALRNTAPGDGYILASTIVWSVFSILSRHGLKRYPASLLMLFVMSAGWLLTSVWLIIDYPTDYSRLIPPDAWLAVVFLGVVCSGMAYLFFYDALKYFKAAVVGTFLNLEPIVTMALAAIFIDEPVTIVSVLGGLLILGGVWLVNRKQEIPNNMDTGDKVGKLLS